MIRRAAITAEADLLFRNGVNLVQVPLEPRVDDFFKGLRLARCKRNGAIRVNVGRVLSWFQNRDDDCCFPARRDKAGR